MREYHVKIFAPAKINLHLEILGKRNDGFHNIISLFQLISLSDRIELKVRSDDRIHLMGNTGIPREDNLVFRAIRKFQMASGIFFGVDVEVHKEIPVGAGLGGGSSDAAATLLSLNELVRYGYGMELEKSILEQIALELGSDVPFFLNGCAALVKGRGETVIPVEPVVGYEVLVVFPGIEINTKEAYQWLDNVSESNGGNREKLDENRLIELYRDGPDSWQFFNSFTEVVGDRYPVLDRIVRFLYDAGASYSNLSGTGGVVFGIFTEKKIENKAFCYLKKNYKFVKLCKPLERKRECVLKL